MVARRPDGLSQMPRSCIGTVDLAWRNSCNFAIPLVR